MNNFLLLTFVLAGYGLIVWIILAILAWAAEGRERFEQTMADHYQADNEADR